MKKLIALLIVVGLMGFVGTAEAGGSSCEGYKGKLLNRCHNVVHPDHPDEWGIGTDVILHEGKEGDVINQVHGEYRWDANNGAHKGYLVSTSKLADVWAKLKALVNRD
jgi:hypothetical protein